MAAGNDPNLEGFVITIRPAWDVHLMLIEDALTGRDSISSGSSSDLGYLQLCLEVFFFQRTCIFRFILDKVFKTAAYENDEEDISYMYDAYLQKLITCFLLTHLPETGSKNQRIKGVLSPYRLVGSHEFSHDSNQTAQASESGPLPFVSLLEFVNGIIRRSQSSCLAMTSCGHL